MTRVLLTLATLLTLAVPTAAQSSHPADAWLDREFESLVALYRHLHENPELSFREVKTARRLGDELKAAGFEVTRNVGGLGVVAVLDNGDGPTVMVRADMDALPIGERTGLEYVSRLRTEDADGRVAGVMHACGHDVHMTVLVGTARWLGAHRGQWSGTAICIGQPAEERSGGAKAMLADGLFDRFPRPDFALALHVTNELPTGTVGVRAGAAMANVESVDVTMFGRGGHGAAPHTTIDPVVQAAQLVLALQTIVSREISPTDPAVVTVGSIHGGQKHNIIGDRCQLQITVRSYDDEVHARVLAAIERKAKAVAMGAGAPAPKVEFSEHTPAMLNDAALTARIEGAFQSEFGADHVVTVGPVMTGEDFGRYGRAGVPISMFRLGTIEPERMARLRAAGEAPPPLHSAFYYPDAAPSIRSGVRAMRAAVLELTGR